MDVSSVHCPGSSLNGPPPTMSSIGSNVPGGLELQRGAQGIAHRQSDQTPPEAILGCYLTHWLVSLQLRTYSSCSYVSGESRHGFAFAMLRHNSSTCLSASSPVLP